MTHTHPCVVCGDDSEQLCDGRWEANPDGYPDAICPVYHQRNWTLNPKWICERCANDAEAECSDD